MEDKFLEWLDDFVKGIENPEIPNVSQDSDPIYSGYVHGAFDTQTYISGRLRYAVDNQRKLMKKLESEKVLVNPFSSPDKFKNE